jgi:hypothetical protein
MIKSTKSTPELVISYFVIVLKLLANKHHHELQPQFIKLFTEISQIINKNLKVKNKPSIELFDGIGPTSTVGVFRVLKGNA